MPLILVTNDDGVTSEGIHALAEAMKPLGEVLVVAPLQEASAIGHALTLRRPLRIETIRDGVYGVDGTPTDCVNLGVLSLFKDNPPDFVASGINFGPNLGDDVTYSGTVSAGFEGTLLGIPSVAFSQEMAEGFSFRPAAAFARELFRILIQEREMLPKDRLLNVNIPAGPVQGVSLTRLGRRVYKQSVIEKLDPRGRKYYWIHGTPQWEKASGTDFEAMSSGRISVTPLHLDLTYYPGLESLGDLRDGLAGVDLSDHRTP